MSNHSKAPMTTVHHLVQEFMKHEMRIQAGDSDNNCAKCVLRY
ncbi:MAG: hypothetical protein ACJATI_005485 [Halioglobus sp.]|jgi:hypothetical protein